MVRVHFSGERASEQTFAFAEQNRDWRAYPGTENLAHFIRKLAC